jgi:hypothetical protein
LIGKNKKSAAPANESAGPSRLRLPTESALRPLSGIRDLLTEAGNKRACTIELPWTTNKPNQRFILTVCWGWSSTDANWAFYEENEVESRVLWSQLWSASDLDLMYDMIAMAADPGATAHAQIPDALKPGPEEPPEESSAGKKAEAPAKEAPPPPPPQPNPATVSGVNYAIPYPYPMPGHPYGAPMPYPMPYPMPQQGYPQGYPPGYPPQPQPGYPPQGPPPGYPQDPNSTGWNYPPAAPQQGAPQQAAPAPAAPPPTPAPTATPPAPQATTSPAASAPPRSAQDAATTAMPIDMDLLQKRTNILLGTLLTGAELITEPTLEAALKIQDLVRAGRLTSSRAPELLKLFFSMGAAIEDYIDPSEFVAPNKPKVEPAKKPAPGADMKELHQAFELLIKSGLLTENDIKTAQEVRQKHGGDIRNILQAAGKVDSKTMAAAGTCASLVQANLMKVEQCIIALNYCSRSRVGFDEALEELRWENPRKAAKKS